MNLVHSRKYPDEWVGHFLSIWPLKRASFTIFRAINDKYIFNINLVEYTSSVVFNKQETQQYKITFTVDFQWRVIVNIGLEKISWCQFRLTRL